MQSYEEKSVSLQLKPIIGWLNSLVVEINCHAMKIRVLKLKNWLLLSLLSLLGFSGCRSTKDVRVENDAEPMLPKQPVMRSEIVLMYGVPTANYHVVGRVVDTKGAPVEGIQVLRLERGMDATPDSVVGDVAAIQRYTFENAVTTAADGKFQMSFTDRPFNELRLLVRDVDGESNGSYRNQIYTIEINSKDFEGGKGWNTGTATLNVSIPVEERR